MPFLDFNFSALIIFYVQEQHLNEFNLHQSKLFRRRIFSYRRTLSPLLLMQMSTFWEDEALPDWWKS